MEDKINKVLVGTAVILSFIVAISYFVGYAPQPASLFLNQAPHKVNLEQITPPGSKMITSKWVSLDVTLDANSLWEYCHHVRFLDSDDRYIYALGSDGDKQVVVRFRNYEQCAEPGFRRISKSQFPGGFKSRMHVTGMLRFKQIAKFPPDYRTQTKASFLTAFIEADASPNKFITYLLFALIVVLYAMSRLHARFGKDLMDLTCAVLEPDKHYGPGDTVRYTAEFNCKGSCELTRLSVQLISVYSGSRFSYTAFKNKKVHIEKMQCIIGSSQKIEDSFVLPEKKNLHTIRNQWKLVFTCELKSALDKTETIELKTGSMSFLGHVVDKL